MSTNDYEYRLLDADELGEEEETPKVSAVGEETEETEKEEEVTL